MNIKKYIKECYEIAKSKGFYPEDSKIEDHLMGIVSELGEVYEAHRGGKFADLDHFNIYMDDKMSTPEKLYGQYLSGTFEDELADVFIRLFNLCGFLHIEDFEEYKPLLSVIIMDNTNKFLLMIDRKIGVLSDGCSIGIHQNYIAQTISFMFQFCKHNNIPIEKHILAKMQYNKTREHLHGKQY